MIDRALDAGVNLIDTADVYAFGQSEEILGAAIRDRRDDVLVATKVGFGARGPGALSYDNVVAACEASLGRLGTDRIDLYQLHRPDRTTPIEETLRALDDLVARGLVRATGTSNFRSWEVSAAVARQRALGRTAFTAAQLYYSLVGREAEHELIPRVPGRRRRRHRVEPAVGRLPHRSLLRLVPATARVKAGAPRSRSRRSIPTSAPGRSPRSSGSRARAASRWRRSRWPGCSPSPASRRPSSARAASSSSTTTWPQPTSCSRPTSSPALDAATALAPIYPAWWDPAMGIPGPNDPVEDQP